MERPRGNVVRASGKSESSDPPSQSVLDSQQHKRPYAKLFGALLVAGFVAALGWSLVKESEIATPLVEVSKRVQDSSEITGKAEGKSNTHTDVGKATKPSHDSEVDASTSKLLDEVDAALNEFLAESPSRSLTAAATASKTVTASASKSPAPSTSCSAAVTPSPSGAGSPSASAAETPSPTAAAPVVEAAVVEPSPLADTALPLTEIEDGLSESQLREREQASDAPEWERIAGLPQVTLDPNGVSYPALRRMIRDELCTTTSSSDEQEQQQATCTSDLHMTGSMKAYLAEYSRRHAAMRAKWSAVATAAKARGGIHLTAEEASAIRWLVYVRCCGGLGDQIKGWSNALLAALLSPQVPGRAFVMNWITKIPIEQLWRPCPRRGDVSIPDPAGTGATASVNAPLEGIDWIPPPDLAVSGVQDQAQEQTWTAMGLSVGGTAWQEGELAAHMDVSNAASSRNNIVFAWGNYMWPTAWTASNLLRYGHVADISPNDAWWTAAGSTYADGQRVAGATAAPSPLAVGVNDGARRISAAVWCRLPVELRGLLRLRSFCRWAAAFSEKVFGDWRIAPTDSSTEIMPPPSVQALRAPDDLSFGALTTALAAAGKKRRLREDSGVTAEQPRNTSALTDHGTHRRRQRQLQGGQCIPSDAIPLKREDVCANAATGTDPLWPGPKGAGSNNLAPQLMDWLMWPSERILQRLQPLLAVFHPGKQYVVGVHMRTGGAGMPGDANIAGPRQLSPVATCCVVEAIRQMARTFGRREEVVVLVFSDSIQARLQVKTSLRGAVVGGMPLRVVDFGSHSGVVHTDLGMHANEGDAAQIADSTVDAFAQHFLLSSVHLLVRSRSGYSETAQAWGRVPLAMQLKFSESRCETVSAYEFRSMSTWERRMMMLRRRMRRR